MPTQRNYDYFERNYGGRLGNDQPGDGYKYRGRGDIQNTGKANYRELGPKIAALWGAGPDDPTFDLVANPDNLLNPDMSAAAAAIYFRDHTTAQGYSIPQAANNGDWTWVRRLVQGGTAGLDRLVAIAGALEAAPSPQPSPAPAPVPPSVDPRDQTIADLTLALRTLRDETIPAIRAQVDECDRIVQQFAGSRS